VRSGETFASVLDSLSVAPTLASQFYRSLSAAGLSRLYPGDSLIVSRTDQCSLASISYLSRLQYWYHANKSNDSVTTVRQPIAATVSRCLLNGRLETSLLDAMEQEGLGPWLACMIADIFAWDINFFLDPRKGDTFQILFTRKYAEGRSIGYGDVLAARYTCGTKDFYALAFADSSGRISYFDCSGKSVQKEFLKAPLRFSRISSGFSYHRRHPVLGIVRPHLAIDYAAPAGTPVYAAADGKVTGAGWDNNYGKNVVLSHGGSFTTHYGHLASIAAGVRAGAYVKQGQQIGSVGATGLATGPHLDYRMKKNGSSVNPLRVILPSKSGISQAEAADFNRVKESYLALLNFRCAGQLGYFVLDLESTAPADTLKSSNQLPLSSNTHGIKSGS
jgi:murein DD-endopeptidase MepM/ murein hydrolase activator NlpD